MPDHQTVPPESEPEITHDPREQGIGDGLPEEAPAAAVPGDPDRHPAHDEKRDRIDAPSTSSPADGKPSQATGNPAAAGG